MPKQQDSLNNDLFDLLQSRGYNPVMLNTAGKEIPVPAEAEVFQFQFEKDGEDYGTATVSIDGLRKLVVYFGDKIADSPKVDTNDSESWYHLLRQIRRFALKHQLSFETRNIDKLDYDMAKREHTKKLDEGYYPAGKKASISDNTPTVKMRIQHTREIQEGEQRFRNIARIFVENSEGERFLLPTNKPGLARVFARHIAEGGTPYDDRGQHIAKIVEEYQHMAGFVRATRNGQFNKSAQKLVNEGINHYQKLRESLHRMAGKRGYNEYFENWSAPLMEDEEQVDLSEMFMSSSLDPRIESVMPILSKLSKNITETAELAEVKELEEWADSVTEGDVAEGSVTPDVNVSKVHDDGHEKEWHIYRGKEMIGYVVKNQPDTAEGLYIAYGHGPGRAFVEEFTGLKPAVNYIASLKEGVAEGSNESYIIIRTDKEGKQDVFAKFDTYQKAQKELDACLAHPLHTKYKQKFELKRKGQQGVAEGSKNRDDGLIGGRYTQDEWDQMLNRLKQLAHKQEAEKAKQAQPKPEQKTDESISGPQQAAGQLDATSKVTVGGKILGEPSKSQQGLRGKLVGGTTESVEHPVSEEVDTGQYDARKSSSKGKTTPEQEKDFRKKVQSYGKELEQRQKEKSKGQSVKEGQDYLDAIKRLLK